jgi:hypothetical protein
MYVKAGLSISRVYMTRRSARYLGIVSSSRG